MIKLALRVVREHYGYTLAKDFGPLALRSVREVFIRGTRADQSEPPDLLVKQFFKWATEHESVPLSVFHGLQAVGWTPEWWDHRHETEPVRPVPMLTSMRSCPCRPADRRHGRAARLTGMDPPKWSGCQPGT